MTVKRLFWLLTQIAAVASLIFQVPSSPPSNASVQLDPAPIGVSLEFFTFPAYLRDLDATSRCLGNLKDLSGIWPPIRIGGTTQDRATYDASSTNVVTYNVSDPADAPSSLTFGPSFVSLAATYGGNVTLGLNRRLNNQTNTIAAAQLAASNMANLYAIELGNEPNFYSASDPISGGSWNASKDFSSQTSWQTSVGRALSTSDIFQGGVYFGTGGYTIKGLAAAEGNAISYVRSFSSHNYPQSASTADLSSLMSHSKIASQISQFASEHSAATTAGKDYVIGETNSATQGGGGISPTYGAGLWILDYVIQSLILGVKALYFHQGTIGNCQYCWWGRYDIGAPYYGAYFAALALANADRIAPLDTGTTAYAAYAVYRRESPVRVLLYNSDYYASGVRSSQTFTLTGLTTSTVNAKRLTAPYTTSRQDKGQNPTIGGQTFANGTCTLQGTATTETTIISGGSATFTLSASEALLIYL